MDVLPFGVKLELSVALLYAVEPSEKQEKVSFPDTVVEEVGTCCIPLPKHGQPAGLPMSKIAADKVWVQMAGVRPFYARLVFPWPKRQILNE